MDPQQAGGGVGLETLATLEGPVVGVHGHDVGLQLSGLDEGSPTPLTHERLLSWTTQTPCNTMKNSMWLE